MKHPTSRWAVLVADGENLPAGRFSGQGTGETEVVVPNPRFDKRPDPRTPLAVGGGAGVLLGFASFLGIMSFTTSPSPGTVLVGAVGAVIGGCALGMLTALPLFLDMRTKLVEWANANPIVGPQDHRSNIPVHLLSWANRSIMDLLDDYLRDDVWSSTRVQRTLYWDVASSLLTIQEAEKNAITSRSLVKDAYQGDVLHVFELLQRARAEVLVERTLGHGHTSTALQEIVAELQAINEARGETARTFRVLKEDPSTTRSERELNA